MLGSRLKDMRMKIGATSKEVAFALRLHETTYGKYELGNREPDIETMQRLALFYGTTISYLVGETDNPFPEKNALRIPILGRIPAGIPIEAVEDIDDWEEIPVEWAAGGKEYFGLKIRGNSMESKYRDGDTVIFIKASDCNSGDECAIMVNGEDATFKKVLKRKAGIILQPLNTTDYEPVFYNDDEVIDLPITIVGIAKEIRRKT